MDWERPNSANCAPPSALPRQTLSASAVEALRTRILRGEFKENETLNQVAIAREYGISRIPLREAMRQLEAEGLLLFQPGKGAVVPGLSIVEIAEVVGLRAKLEPEVLVRAIPHMTRADLAEAGDILDQFEAALRSNAIASWGELNWRFHAALYAPSRRALTLGFVQTLHRLNQRYTRVQIALTKWEKRAAREHRAILAACRRKDKPQAAALLRRHILTAGQALIQLLEEQRRAGTNAEAVSK